MDCSASGSCFASVRFAVFGDKQVEDDLSLGGRVRRGDIVAGRGASGIWLKIGSDYIIFDCCGFAVENCCDPGGDAEAELSAVSTGSETSSGSVS